MKFRLNQIGIILAIFLLSYPLTVAKAVDNDHLFAELRVDLPAIYNAANFRVLIQANDIPNNGTAGIDFTAGWIGVNLAQNYEWGPPDQFSQVGLLTDPNGLHWFVYSEVSPHVTCSRGRLFMNNLGCEGEDIVQLHQFYLFELVHVSGQGYWAAGVYDISDNYRYYELAQIHWDGTRIYRAMEETEEGFSTTQDLQMTASFYHAHPLYFVPNTGYIEWPLSTGGLSSTLFYSKTDYPPYPNTFCPQIYGLTIIYPDERFWYAGSPFTGVPNPGLCNGLLFPSTHIYMPLISKN